MYHCKKDPITGSSYDEVLKKAKGIFSELSKQTKRKTYIRSKYFDKQKIFFDYFWEHLFQKPKRQRLQRLKLLPCGIELLQYSSYKPEIKPNPNKKSETLYRFTGITSDKKTFNVQIKQTAKNQLQCMSIFPYA